MNRIYKNIDASFEEYEFNRFTNILIELLMASIWKLNAFCMKLSIQKGKLVPIKRLHVDVAGKPFARRGESMINFISKMLEKMSIPDCVFYVSVQDNYLYYDVPIFTYAKPKTKKGLLIPDHTWIDAEPENMAIESYVSFQDVKRKMNKFNKTVHKIDELFFIGQDIASYDRTNIRRFFALQPKPFNVSLNKYVSMEHFCEYSCLLNLSGAWPWSFRFKFLFLTNSLVINVACYWMQVFDPLFIPGVDYINVERNADFNVVAHNILEQCATSDISAITASGYKKSKLLTQKNIYSVLHYCINTWRLKCVQTRMALKAPDVFIKKIKLGLNKMEGYNEIKFYDTMERNGLSHLVIPLLNFYIEKGYLVLEYARSITIAVPRIDETVKHRINKIISVIKLLHIKIPDDDIMATIAYYKNDYYLTDFTKYVCPEHIKSR
jgi:hypothetical protein